MKKKNLFTRLMLSAAVISSMLFSSIAYASEVTTTTDIPVGGSGQMEMVGIIEPTILSVTIPALVPFNISNNVAAQNKVISPRINVINNSNIPVQIDIVHTRVDISKLENTTWSNDGIVGPNQIAIGLKEEEIENEMPTELTNAKWLPQNQDQNLNLLVLDAYAHGALYVVGTLGQEVSENGTFNVTPIFVVRKTAITE